MRAHRSDETVPAVAETLRLLSVAAFLLLGSCGGNADPTGPDRGVATIALSGAPAGPALVGSSIQLVATPLNSSGAVVSGQTVTWSSSNTSLATVTSGGLVTILGAGSAVISARSGQAAAGVTLDLRDGGAVGTAGGTLSVLDGMVTLVIPSGALTQTTVLLFRPMEGGVVDPRMVGGSSFEVGPEALNLGRTATLTVRYDPAKLASGTVESALQLYALTDGAWLQVRGSEVDLDTHSVTGSFRRAGSYAVSATPVSRISIGGALASGALYVGESQQLIGTAYDANDDVLAGRVLTWSSADPQIADVDATGLVIGVAQGTATITAEADGQAASVSFPILSAPVPSWSQTSEWSTYQGGSRHTGAIKATLDPAAFNELWTGSPMRGPVTVGDGKVYAVAGTSVVALDARTGAQRWTYDLGARDSFDPPAFGNGAVYLQTGGHGNSFVWAVSAADGSLLWRTSYLNQWSPWYAPTVVGPTVYVAAGYYGGMAAYDASTGEERWFVSLNQYDSWTPAVLNGLAYAYTGSHSPKVSVVDASTGALSYEIADPGFQWRGWSMHLAPVLGDQNDLIAQQDFRLVSFDLTNHAIRWEIPNWTSPWGNEWQATVSNGVIYAFNGTQVDARRESDGGLLWSWPLPSSGAPVGTLIATDNLLFVSASASGTADGVTYAVDINVHRQVWSYPLAGRLAMSADGVLFISGSKLAAIAMK